YVWSGNHWKKDRRQLLKRLVAGQLASQYLSISAVLKREAERESDEDKAREKRKLVGGLVGRAFNLRRVSRTKHILEFAASLLGITGDEWDLDPWLLALSNGIVDLRTGAFRPGRPEDYIRITAPTQWRGLNEPSPRFNEFIKEIFSDQKESSELG